MSSVASCLLVFYGFTQFMLFIILRTNSKKSDELILAKEHFAEIGDDLDFSFVELIDGIDPVYSYRRPKPPTPPPRPETPAEERAARKAAAALAAGVSLEAAAAAEGGAAPGEGGEAGLAAPVVAKEASPFDLQKHFPPDAAEVPFVKSFENPKAKTPTPPPPAPQEEAPAPEPAAEEAAPAPEESAPAPAEEPAAEAPPAE